MSSLINYLDNSISPYHAVKYVTDKLEKNGFTKLEMGKRFNINAGGAYYVSPYPTSLFAFKIPEMSNVVIPSADELSFRIASAHTDFPTFKIKPEADIKSAAGGIKRINIEPYGGMLKKTWFDRPLGIAGIVMLKSGNAFSPEEVIFDSESAWVYIPSLAPHMDREIEKKEVDVAKEMLPLIFLDKIDENSFAEYIANKLSKDLKKEICKEDILSYDLNLYDTTKAEYAGINKEFLISQRIDNIASVAALTDSIIKSNPENHISLIALFDNEEIGSRTKQGADSEILNLVIQRICESDYLKDANADYKDMLVNSMMLSVDGAHAVHPNYPEKADLTTTAVCGKGFVIKTSASQRYVSDPKMLAIIKAICEENNIPYQVQANKSGTPGGQTLGPIASSYLPVPAADMGVPMLAMHSVREMMAERDFDSLLNFVELFLF